MRSHRRFAAALVVPAVALLAACGGGADAASDAPPAFRDCAPVGADRANEVVATVAVGLDEYAFTPSATTAPAGVVTFAATNRGSQEHELAFLPGGGDVPLDAKGRPDEDALTAAGAFELEGFGPDRTCEATFELDTGTYTLFCIVHAADGTTHLSKGMRGTLEVSAPAGGR
jgi:plastocyanin